MKILAVNSAMQSINCQPIKPDFTGKKQPKENAAADTFTPSDPYTTEQKYNLACQIAAYYKNKYEQLVNKTDKCYA